MKTSISANGRITHWFHITRKQAKALYAAYLNDSMSVGSVAQKIGVPLVILEQMETCDAGLYKFPEWTCHYRSAV
jgi:hypothetical protein